MAKLSITKIFTFEAAHALNGYDGLCANIHGHSYRLEVSVCGPDSLSFPELMKRIEEGSFKEIIIATNPTEEGDTTALYIKHLLKDRGISLSRLASGLPIGGDLGYADKLTLMRSLKGRIRL